MAFQTEEHRSGRDLAASERRLLAIYPGGEDDLSRALDMGLQTDRIAGLIAPEDAPGPR